MMMENVNYGRDELMFLNMVRQGVIGDLLHGEAAYIPCLVTQLGDTRGEGAWRPEYHTRINGNPVSYTHLSPIRKFSGNWPMQGMLSRAVWLFFTVCGIAQTGTCLLYTSLKGVRSGRR